MIGEAAPSYWVVRDIALRIPNDLRTLTQQGARRYGELYDLVHRRDGGDMGMILIGMPGIKKRIARFPQLYWRIGFVHEFRPLGNVEMQDVLQHRWTPAGVSLPEGNLTPEVVARLIRITSGNLRLLTRLQPQVERLLSVNDAPAISVQIVEAARDSLVIGQD